MLHQFTRANFKTLATDGGAQFMLKKNHIYFCFLFLFLLNACDNSANRVDKFNTGLNVCLQSQIKNEFIVQWKNGEITKVKSLSEDDFKTNFMKANYDDIEMAEPNYQLSIDNPNINLFRSCPRNHWALDNINVRPFWEKNITGKDILIAVSDSGIDIDNPTLKDRIAYNQGEMGLDSNGNDKSKNNIDDDNNGYVDDYYGYDFFENDKFS